MKPDVKIQLLKFCFRVFNSVFLVLGLSVAGCAVWILFDGGSLLTLLSSDELRIVGVGLLLIGGLVLLACIIGCVGAEGGSRILLLTYLGCLIILVLGQVFVTLLLFIKRDPVERSLEEMVDGMIHQYGPNSNSRDRMMDKVQNSGHCCGRTGPADWLKNSYIQSLNRSDPDILPCSCYSRSRPGYRSPWCSELNLTEPHFGQGTDFYEQGCQTQLSDWLQENLLTIFGMAFGLMLLQVVQFVSTVYLHRVFGRKAALKGTSSMVDSDHAHRDHAPEDDLDYAMQNYGYIDPDDDFIDPTQPEHYHDYHSHVNRTHLAYRHDNKNY